MIRINPTLSRHLAIITVVLSLERVVGWGERLARMTGIVAGVAGIAFLLTSIG